MERNEHRKSSRRHVSASGIQKISRSIDSRSRYVFFGMFERVFDNNNVRWKFVPRWKRIGVVALSSFAALWILSAIGIWCGYKFIKKYDEVSFVKVALLPFYISEHRRDMGEYNIKIGMQSLKEGNPQKALQCLYKGVVQSPDNMEARIALAQIYLFGVRDPVFASTLLEYNLPAAVEKKNKTYIALSLISFIQLSDYAEKFAILSKRSIDVGILTEDEYLKIISPAIKQMHDSGNDENLIELSKIAFEKFSSPNLKNFFAVNGAFACTAFADYPRAWDFIKAAGLERGETGAQIGTRIMWQNGEEIKALRIARELSMKSQNNKSAYGVLIDFYKELGNKELAELAEDAMALTSGKLHSSKLLQIMRAENQADKNKLVDEYFNLYSKSLDAIQELLTYAVRVNDADILERCIQIKFDNPYFEKFMKMSKIEFLIRNKKLDAANEEILLLSYKNDSSDKIKDMMRGFDISLKAMSGKSVEPEISQFMFDMNRKPNAIISLAMFLSRIGLFEQAEFILLRYMKVFPNDYRTANILALIYSTRNDMSSLAALAVNSRVPIPQVLRLKDYLKSDASIYIKPQDRKVLIEKVGHADAVIKAARKI